MCQLIEAPQSSYKYGVVYGYFSVGYGKDAPPVGSPGVSKPSSRRCRIVPGCARILLLRVWTEVNLVDPSENSGQ